VGGGQPPKVVGDGRGPVVRPVAKAHRRVVLPAVIGHVHDTRRRGCLAVLGGDPPHGLPELVDAHVHFVQARERHKCPVARVDAVAAELVDVLIERLAALGLDKGLKVGAVVANVSYNLGAQRRMLRSVRRAAELVAQCAKEAVAVALDVLERQPQGLQLRRKLLELTGVSRVLPKARSGYVKAKRNAAQQDARQD